MTSDSRSRRPSVAGRRIGYAIAVLINGALWLVVNVWPGWRAAPFLTEATTQVLWLVNLSLVVGLVINAIYLAYDPPWCRALGDLVTTVIALVTTTRIWQVFPFALATHPFNWAMLARVLLMVAIVGSVIGVIAQIVALARLGRRGA